MNKEKIIVSSCLLGNKVRYNGTSSLNPNIVKLRKNYQLVSMCPEILGGLNLLRDPSEIKDNKVISIKGKDLTKEFLKGANYVLDYAKKHNIKACILKSKSPSCGKDIIYDGTFSKTLRKGNGYTANLLIKAGIKVYNENNFLKLVKGDD